MPVIEELAPPPAESAYGRESARGPHGRQEATAILIHGFNGLPSEMSELGARLAARGFVTRTVQLPGHAGQLRELAMATWEDWFAAAAGAVGEALARSRHVVVVGHSLGAALALAVSAAEPEVTAVTALCPPLRMRRGVVEAVGVLRYLVPYVPALRCDISDRRASLHRLDTLHAYDWIPLRTVHSLFRGLALLCEALPRVRCPALVMCASHDHVVPMRDGVEAYELLGSERKELVVLERSYHLVLRDVERASVIERVSGFCASTVFAETER
ncbi:MAG: alpha/beta fold hydrolase [Ktedonobacterales bacterium]|nr:alpha/beta fold hydrolase [Ktedonobacterales bacterium]